MTALLSVIVLAANTFATPSAPALCSSPPAPVEQASFARGITPKATCTALCGSSPSVSCSGDTCNAVNQNCSAGVQGHVTCNTTSGTTTYHCPACPPECLEGQIKIVTGPTCSCPPNYLSTPKDRYECIGGQWVYQSSFCGAPFCREW